MFDLAPAIVAMLREGRCRIFAGPPTPDALRARLYRERRRRGVRLVGVEVSEDVIDELRKRELISPDDMETPAALAFAIGQLIEEQLL